MKKKLAAGMLSAVLTAGMVFPVYAQDTQKGEVTVTATVDSAYTLSVPKVPVNIPYGQVNTDLEITVSGNVASDKTVSVTTVDGSLKSGNLELPYTIDSTALSWAGTEMTKDGTTKKGVLTIKKETWDAAQAGTYTDTVTFTATMQ